MQELFYLLSKKEDWRVHISDIKANCLNVHEETISKAMAELRLAGHAKLNTILDEDGKITSREYDIYQTPIEVDKKGIGISPNRKKACQDETLLGNSPDRKKACQDKHLDIVILTIQ